MNNTLTQFIKVFPNALSTDDCLRLITHFESNETHWGPVVNGDGSVNVDLSLKRVKQLHIRDDTDPEIDNLLFESTGTLLEQYVNDVNDFYPQATRDIGYQIQKYDVNDGFYGWHNDANAGIACGRTLAIVWYLNTVKEGGETEFRWGKKITPRAGSALIFPANWLYPHRANIPTSGPKYVATTWVGF